MTHTYVILIFKAHSEAASAGVKRLGYLLNGMMTWLIHSVSRFFFPAFVIVRPRHKCNCGSVRMNTDTLRLPASRRNIQTEFFIIHTPTDALKAVMITTAI